MTIYEFSGENRFLSNFHPAPIVIQGITYPTSEHAYQAGKTTSQKVAENIAAASSPGVAKRVGRQIELRPDWDDRCDDWMKKVVYEKFRQHPDLMAKLQGTGDQILIEGNTWHDQRWGNCTCPKHIGKPGDNQLGKILMDLRRDLTV